LGVRLTEIEEMMDSLVWPLDFLADDSIKLGFHFEIAFRTRINFDVQGLHDLFVFHEKPIQARKTKVKVVKLNLVVFIFEGPNPLCHGFFKTLKVQLLDYRQSFRDRPGFLLIHYVHSTAVLNFR